MSNELGRNFEGYEYQTDKVLLLPYKDHRDVFREDLLVHLYARMEKDGTLDRVFAGMSKVTLNRFVSYLSSKPVVIYLIKPNDVVGFGWITQSEGRDGARKASAGFTFFKNYWGTPLVRDLCWLSLRWWFYELNIDVLYGSLLKTNRVAINFCRHFGFCVTGSLPMFFEKDGILLDGTLMYLPRTVFDPLYESWEVSQQEIKVIGNGHGEVLTS